MVEENVKLVAVRTEDARTGSEGFKEAKRKCEKAIS